MIWSIVWLYLIPQNWLNARGWRQSVANRAAAECLGHATRKVGIR